MSSALAIATVTHVLRDRLTNVLSRAPVSDAVPGAEVSTSPPSRIQTGDDEKARVNIFLYHVTPNAGWRNVALPSRDARGHRESNPPLALDLHYLVSAYGKRDGQAEILLGHAMQALHDTPVLTRPSLTAALAAIAAGDTTRPERTILRTSDLAEQVELVKITPLALSMDEMSKVWATLQSEYRPSAAYHASVVLIERQDLVRSPLPVLTIGPVIGDRPAGIMVTASLVPPFPTLEAAAPPDRRTAVAMGELLTLRGHHLGHAADAVTVRFAHVPSQRTWELVPVSRSDATVVVQMPPDPPAPGPPPLTAAPWRDPDNWQAGLHAVSVVITSPAAPAPLLSNEIPVMIAPRLTLAANAVSVSGDTLTIDVTVSPKVWRTQRLSLIVGTHEIAGPEFTDDKRAALRFQCPREDVDRGPQVIRVRVDGVENQIIRRPDDLPPSFDPSAQVTIP